jgi:spoIIIJ-associated protein
MSETEQSETEQSEQTAESTEQIEGLEDADVTETSETPEASDNLDTELQDAAMVAEGAEESGADVDDDADESDDGADEDDETGGTGDPATLEERLEQEGDIAADYLEELLDIADLDGDLDMDVEGERAVVSIVGAELQQLVGDQGKVLDALQELTRLAVYRETGERSRLMLDISGHRAARRRELEELAATTASEVKESGERVSLRPMTPFERKVVHDAVAAAGLTSESEGVEPRRYVVVLPA